MQIDLICVGQKMPSWVETGFNEYVKRLPPTCRLNLIEIPLRKRTKNADLARLQQKEGEQMLATIAQGTYIIALDERGPIWATQQLASKLAHWMQEYPKVALLIGGPEGLAIAHNKLYAALNYKDSVATISLNDETVSYIETPAVTSYFVKDNNDNLYVSLISTYSDFSSSTGLGYINTSNDQLEATYQLDGVSTSYVNILSPNADFSKLYVMTSAYDANWNLSGAIAVFDVASKSFDSNMLLEGVYGLNGIGYEDDKVFSFVAESVTGNGKAITYSTDGAKQKEYETGIAPFMLLTTD